MGNIMHTRPPETSTMSNPILRTPFSDLTCQIGHSDGNEECLAFQLRFIDCCEAYGSSAGYEKCKYYYQDFVECTKGWKQRARVADMMEQRYYRTFQGLLGKGPQYPLYGEKPRYDGFSPFSWYDDVHW